MSSLEMLIFSALNAAVPAPGTSPDPLMQAVTTAGGIFVVIASALGIFYTWREKRVNSISSYRQYEKDLQQQMRDDIKKLRENSEKYHMLRLKVLQNPAIDGDELIREVEREYKEMNPE